MSMLDIDFQKIEKELKKLILTTWKVPLGKL